MKNSKTYAKSSSFIIAMVSGIILLLVFSVLSFFLYIVSTSDFIGQAKRAIESDAQQFLRWHDEGGIEKVSQQIAMRENRGSDQIYFLADRDKIKISGMLNVWPQNKVYSIIQNSEGTFFNMVQYEIRDADIATSWVRPPLSKNEAYQIFTQTLEFPNGEILLIGRNLTDVERFRDLIGEMSSFALVVLGIIVILNFFISIYVVNRVNRIAGKAGYVTETGDLSARIEKVKGWDDLSYLARTINSMMDYIESLVENVKQVSDNIAHDLRSPLTRLQNRIDSLDPQQPISLEEKQALKAESEALLSMFAAILRISEIEAGRHVFERQDFDIKLLMNDVIEFFEPVAQEKSIQIRGDVEECIFPIDRDLIFQALLNIMENALKFTPENGHIHLKASLNASNQLEIIIADSGPGISYEEKEKVFNRFYRADESRTTPGNGLGLSMVKAIIDFHKGIINLEDNNPGLLIRIKINSQ